VEDTLGLLLFLPEKEKESASDLFPREGAVLNVSSHDLENGDAKDDERGWPSFA
jgi:hypothetical protein